MTCGPTEACGLFLVGSHQITKVERNMTCTGTENLSNVELSRRGDEE